MKNRNSDEILQYIASSGMLDIGNVERAIDMQKNKEYLSKHTQKIWQGKDAFWRTYLPYGKNGRTLIKRKSENSLHNEIISFYRNLEENPTIEDVFSEWNDRRLSLGKIKKSTYERNLRIFQRHYSVFGKEKLKHLDKRDLIDFLEEQISIYHLTAKSFSNLKSLTRGFLKRASATDLISFTAEDVFQRLDLTDTTFKKTIKEDYQEVYNDQEMQLILDYLMKNPDSTNLAICLIFVTGLRVGELVALKHEDFDELSVKVRRTETRYKNEAGKTVYEVKDFPKSAAGVRTIPVPADYAWLLKRIRLLNPFGEYVFMGRNGRLTTNSVRSRLRTICRKLEIYPKSPHKIRKTYGSILLDNNIDHRLIKDVMGHTDILCTETHYHRNRKTIEVKQDILSQIPEFRAN